MAAHKAVFRRGLQRSPWPVLCPCRFMPDFGGFLLRLVEVRNHLRGMLTIHLIRLHDVCHQPGFVLIPRLHGEVGYGIGLKTGFFLLVKS